MRGRAIVVAVVSAVAAVASAVSTGPGAAALGTRGRGEILRPPSRRAALTVPPGFQDTVAISGLNLPTVIQFAPDGRIFIGEKGGVVLEYDSLTDPTPTVVADLSTNVYDYSDRGLLGLALDPNFLTNSYLYVLYTLDAPIGQQPPVYNDTCGGSYCVAGARVSRMLLDANNHGGPAQGPH